MSGGASRECVRESIVARSIALEYYTTYSAPSCCDAGGAEPGRCCIQTLSIALTKKYLCDVVSRPFLSLG